VEGTGVSTMLGLLLQKEVNDREAALRSSKKEFDDAKKREVERAAEMQKYANDNSVFIIQVAQDGNCLIQCILLFVRPSDFDN
jgi:transcription initiation factor IIF auxiliary subunit